MLEDRTKGKSIRTIDGLAAAGLIAPAVAPDLALVADRFDIAITPVLANRIDRDDPNDPIARQFVPSAQELEIAPDERADPIGDAAHSPVPGIVHRYPDRVLLKVVTVCPVYCRFCFRRELIGPGAEALTKEQLDTAIDYIARTPAVREVILTGGDPLILSPARLGDVLQRLAAIPHVRVLRIHGRVPVVDPARIDAAMLAALDADRLGNVRGSDLPLYLLLHANHAREFGPEAQAALRGLSRAGVVLLGQSVLLRGVNDSVAALTDLFQTMVANRVTPHYLHHPDLARGTGHFRLSIEEGQALMRALRGTISGLAVPTYMLDIPGGFGKVPITPSYLIPDGVIDPQGRAHAYPHTVTSS